MREVIASSENGIRVLIDTWWNVNVVVYPSGAFVSWVLIDTWWNVNLLIRSISRTVTGALIDTWWNVNRA